QRSDFTIEKRRITAARQARLLQELREHGYFEGDAILATGLVARIRAGIERLRRAGWPAVFVYVYDEAWAIAPGPSLRRLLSKALGRHYTQKPNVWAHNIQPGTRGWGPHVDGFEGADRLSLWIPLSEATIQNGCMFLVPRDRVPERIAGRFHRTKAFRFKEV